MKFLIKASFLIAYLLASSVYAADPKFYEKISLDDLDLNRTAVKLSSSQKNKFPNAHTGFIWNDGDNNTEKWRPQGLAGIGTTNKKFLAVSWYGRKEANYSNRGVRVSFVNVTNMNSIKYRHVLLVDEDYDTFKGMHAGGLVFRNGELHVPDSRKGTKKIYVFSTDSIKFVPKSDRRRFYNYAYILNRESSYDVPIKPSFLSYDWDRDQVLVGSFNKCSSPHTDTPACLLNSKNRLAWYTIDRVSRDSPSCAPFFSEMQGAGSAINPYSENHVLWVASSYGRFNRSHLHITNINAESCYDRGFGLTNYRTITYPPGLEDMHVSLTSDNIWMLTEFGPHEGSSNNRVVFATKKEKLMP